MSPASPNAFAGALVRCLFAGGRYVASMLTPLG